MKIEVLKDITSANDAIAAQNRQALDKHRILTLNLMSSPGAGKTSLILQTIDRLKNELKLAVIEGDVASKIDADKIDKEGIPVVQINTGASCSLEAQMIGPALDKLPLENIDLLFIENVGNLICPAEFALGEHKKVVISSIPEGDDKPTKYPLMFTEADAVVITSNAGCHTMRVGSWRLSGNTGCKSRTDSIESPHMRSARLKPNALLGRCSCPR